jgi:putative copper export protein
MQTLLHGLNLISLCALAGGLIFLLLLRNDKFAELMAATQTGQRRWLLAWTAITVITSSLSAWTLGWPTWVLLVRLVELFALVVVLRQTDLTRVAVPGAAIAFVLLATQSLTSRSARLPDGIAATLADWFHLSLASVWLGGVALLLVMVWQVWRSQGLAGQELNLIRPLSLALDRFSPLAIFCVLGLAFSGIAQAALFLKSFEALLTTDYGRTLSLKIGLFVVLIGFGAFHQQVILPRLRLALLSRKSVEPARYGPDIARLRISLLLEAGCGAVLLLLVGVMLALPL